MASHALTTGAPARAPAICRRSLLGGFAAMPLVAVTPLPAQDRLEVQFARWKDALSRLNNDDGDEAYDAPLWDQLNAAEDEIVRSDACSPRLAEMRLWIAIEFEVTTLAEKNAIARGDLTSLTSDMAAHDWEAKVLIQALRALVGQRGVC